MDEVLKLVSQAKRMYDTADHLTYVTFPVVNEIKLLATITENLHTALVHGMNAILMYDRMYKRIPPLNSDFNSRFEVFKTKCVPRYNIDRSVVLLLQDLREIIEKRKESPMEFQRKDKFVICSHDYRMKTLSLSKVKEYLNQSKPFFSRLDTIFNKNGRRF